MPLTVADIKREHVEHYLGSLRDRLSPATMNQTYRCLQALWKYLIAEGEVHESPLKNIARPTIPDVPPALVSLDQMKALLRVCEGRDFAQRRDTAILAMFFDTGVRLAELQGMRHPDLDLDLMTIAVTGKFGRPRSVRFSAQTVRALDRYLKLRATRPDAATMALWLGERGPLTRDGITLMIRRRAIKAGLRGIHPHAFRHAFADNYLATGGNEGDLMQLAGWRSRSMVDRYARGVAGQRARDNYDPHSPMERLRRS
jgi:site-specific recombinase XerD